MQGFPEAIETVYPQAAVQLCIVHLVRNSLNYVGWKRRKPIAETSSGFINRLPCRGRAKVGRVRGSMERRVPSIAQIWRRNWCPIIPFFGYPPEIRRIIVYDQRRDLFAETRSYPKWTALILSFLIPNSG
ncbi:MAG: transposase [Methylobacter sp.]